MLSTRTRDDVVSRVSSSGAQAVDAIRAQGNSVADQLGIATDAVARDFSARSNSLIERLESGGARLSDTIVVHGDDLVARLNDAADRLHETVVVRGEVLEDRLTGSSERLSALIRDRAEDAAAILDAAAARWGEQFDARETQLRGRSLTRMARSRPCSTNRHVASSARSRPRALSPQAQIEASAAQSLDQHPETAQINERLASLVREAAAAAANGAGSVHDALSERIAAFDDWSTTAASASWRPFRNRPSACANISRRWTGSSAKAGTTHRSPWVPFRRAPRAHRRHLDAIDGMMKTRRDDFDKRFGDYNEQLTAKSAERLEQFEIASAAHHNAVDFALASHSRRIETSLGDGLARFEGAVDGRGREIVGQIGDGRRLSRPISAPNWPPSRKLSSTVAGDR